MNSFQQHIPPFVDVDRPAPIEFDSTQELLNLDVVKRYVDEEFSHFAMSDECLMVIRNGGANWWVVGYIKHPELVDLPKWSGPTK